MPSTWIARIRDDVRPTDLPNLLNKEGIALRGMSFRETRHLRCNAPVALLSVERARNALDAKLLFMRLQADDVTHTYFEVYPRNDTTTLSEADYLVGEALHLSDPSLLSAQHMGPQYELEFALPDTLIEASRAKLEALGVELDVCLNMKADAATSVFPSTTPDHLGESI